VNTLTLAQIRTLDCGALPLTDYPEQRRVPGSRMPTLTEVLDLVKSADAPGVKLNVETYPDRVRAVMSERGLPLPEPAR
jgi:glycerophosphoryl diester phosphodiesterase